MDTVTAKRKCVIRNVHCPEFMQWLRGRFNGALPRYWKNYTYKFHSYFKKALRSGKISAEKSMPLLQSICQWAGMYHVEVLSIFCPNVKNAIIIAEGSYKSRCNTYCGQVRHTKR